MWLLEDHCADLEGSLYSMCEDQLVCRSLSSFSFDYCQAIAMFWLSEPGLALVEITLFAAPTLHLTLWQCFQCV